MFLRTDNIWFHTKSAAIAAICLFGIFNSLIESRFIQINFTRPEPAHINLSIAFERMGLTLILGETS